jgi:mRNA-degrading endonuclease RelE of RelBE toxin-antitoxin system
MNFSTIPEFDREFKRLLKSWPSLEEDLEILKQFLNSFPCGHTDSVVRISNLGIKSEVYKVRHFRCKDMKGRGGRSGIRIIYAYFPDEQKIEFIEIYHKDKGDRDCDGDRIKRYYP